MAVCENRQTSMDFAHAGAVGGARCGGMGVAFRAAPVDATAYPDQWLAQEEAAIQKESADKKDGQFDIWASIQSSKTKEVANGAGVPPPPYVHPLVRRSASSLSQKSLEICTESLGSETGSEGMLSSDDLDGYFSAWKTDEEELVTKKKTKPEEAVEVDDDGIGAPRDDEDEMEEPVEPMPPPSPNRRKKLASVNYHCSISRKSPTSRSFPPPLPSLCRRDGPCLSMRRHRRDGRLVVEAVPVPSHNYLHAQREGGRLVLTFIETSFHDVYPQNVGPATEFQQQVAQQDREEEAAAVVAEEAEVEDRGMVLEGTGAEEDDVDEEVADEDGEEEEVEVVDRGIVVEVKVSRPPLPQSGGIMKVQRSSVVINKFVGVPLSNHSPWAEQAAARTAPPHGRPLRLGSGTTTTATAVVAVAVAASSSLSTDERYWRNAKGPLSAHRHPSPEKLYFTSKRLTNRQELLHRVRRCSEHHRPLFIWEPCCIATS